MLDGFKRSIGLAMAGKSPWGGGSGSDGGDSSGDGEGASGPESGGGDGPRNPWLPGDDGERRRSARIDDIFRQRGPEGPRRGGRHGGPRLRMPERPGGKSWLPVMLAGIGAVWILLTSVHQVQPKEQGIVTWLGGPYSRTLTPGLNFTFPWPIQQVSIENVSEIRSERIGAQGEKLILTGDQNLVDLSYIIRWNIKDLKQYTFQLDNPQLTLAEVAEAAMRASVAEQDLDSVVSGEGRAEIEGRVQRRMQSILDAYKAGIAIQGIAVERSDPPTKVIEAFKAVSAAQQEADAMRNRARAYAQQILARAQGDAAAFDQIYAQYKLAPEVTRRRLYYETMESVLGKTDKTVIEAQGVTPYLPLPELRKRSQASQPTMSVTPERGQ